MADGKGFSLSFAGGKGRLKRVRANEEEEAPLREAVTGITASGLTLADAGAGVTGVDGKRQRVIPNPGNSFKGLGPKAYNPARFLPQQDELKPGGDADRFEVAAPEERAPVTYGLTTFGKEPDPKPDAAEANGGANGTPNGGEPRGRGRRVIGTGVDWEREAFRGDVGALPDQSSLEEYEAMPVEAFGAAMLRGMGWKEGSENDQAQAREFVRRAPLLGLGATAAAAPAKEKRFIRPGESRQAAPELVVYDSQGNIKHTKTAGEKLVPRQARGAAPGKAMRVLAGQHRGLRCTVQALLPQEPGRSQRAQVRLLPSEESVAVRVKDLGEADEPPSANGGSSRQAAERPEQRQRQQQAGGSSGREGSQNGAAAAAAAGREGEEALWLAPHIRVKVICKRLGKGRLYLKKGEVTDVMAPRLCSISLDTGERVEAQQSQLETVVPKREGARVLVVAGPLKGSGGKLLQRSAGSARAAVQLFADLSVHKLGFDEISEYVGDALPDE